MKKLINFGILIILLTVFCGEGWGATYYVTKSGNDTTGNGSQATPWLTMVKAEATASNGDTVHVETGGYAEAYDGNSGFYSAKSIAWIADGPVTVTGSGAATRITNAAGVLVAPGGKVDIGAYEYRPSINNAARFLLLFPKFKLIGIQ